MNRLKSILWGIVFVAVGIMLCTKIFGYTTFDVFFDGWWAWFIIVPSAINLITEHNRKSDLVWLLIGIICLLGCKDIFDFNMIWKLIVPVALIVYGVKMIIGKKNTQIIE